MKCSVLTNIAWITAIVMLSGCGPSLEGQPAATVAITTAAPTITPSSTSTLTPTITPSPTQRPSPTPTPDVRVIDVHPEILILSLEDLGLEDSYSVWFSQGDWGVPYFPDWQVREAYQEWLEKSGRITGWSNGFYPSGSGNPYFVAVTQVLTIQLDIHRTSSGAEYAYSNSNPYHPFLVLPGLIPEVIGVVDIGFNVPLLHYSYSMADKPRIMYYIEFVFRNIHAAIAYSFVDEMATEEQLNWFVEAARSQVSKLQSFPLSGEVIRNW